MEDDAGDQTKPVLYLLIERCKILDAVYRYQDRRGLLSEEFVGLSRGR